MDGLTLQSKVYAGYAKAALRIGLPYDIYRPMTWDNPLADGPVATVPAAFTVHGPSNFQFGTPADYQKPLFHALLDGAQVQVGDYLVSETNPQGPFFIAAKDAGVPVLAVQCNRTLTAWAPGPVLSVGANGYSGTTQANETAFMTGWPASVLLGARGDRDQQLPEDAGYGSWRILMPHWPGAVIRAGTILTDDINNRMIVQSAELQDLGWRIDATQAVT
jgi:hypothetical protein